MAFLASDYGFWITVTTPVQGSGHLIGLSDYPKFVPRTTLSSGTTWRAGSLEISGDISRAWSVLAVVPNWARRGRR